MRLTTIKFNFSKWRAHILAGYFGISMWLGVNGIFIEMPLLIQELPEGWKLASYLTIVTQLGNLGPILYSCIFGDKNKIKYDRWIISISLLLVTVAMFFVTFFYPFTVLINNSRYSITLMVLHFLISIVACTSPVLFLPYMRHFHPRFLTSFFIGDGNSAMIPSILALIQGIAITNCEDKDKDIKPLFSIRVFFIILDIFYLLTFGSFLLMDRVRLSDPEILPKCENKEMEMDDENNSERQKIIQKTINLKEVYVLNTFSCGICFFCYGFLPAIQAYSCMPFGIMTYHLSLTLPQIAMPVSCFIGQYLPEAGRRVISIIGGIVFLLSAYICITAGLSPHPPLQESSAGVTVIVIVWIITMGLFAYTRMAIAQLLVSHQGPHSTGQALFYCGSWQQIGACLGAVLAFLLVNYTDSFKSYDPCIPS